MAKIIGYVKHKFSNDIQPFVNKDEHGYELANGTWWYLCNEVDEPEQATEGSKKEYFCDECGSKLGEIGYKAKYAQGSYCSRKCADKADLKVLNGPQEKDNVNPDHYKVGGIETFDFIKAKLSKEALEGYCAGNILKYVTRYGHKNGAEDLKKANWYLGKMIESMERVSK